MLTIIIVRHGEVFNPNHVVYADLPGFDLSPEGVRQVHALGIHLAGTPIDVILSSPLARAKHTAVAMSRHHRGLDPIIEHKLTETRMYPGWTGRTWAEVERDFPGQLQGYLSDASSLGDVSESVTDVYERVTASVRNAFVGGHRTIVVVGHQDPSQVLRLGLTGRPLSELRLDPPGHASATTLTSDDGARFVEISTWNPENTEL